MESLPPIYKHLNNFLETKQPIIILEREEVSDILMHYKNSEKMYKELLNLYDRLSERIAES